MEFSKELCKTIITIVDERMKEIKVSREEFELLRRAILDLTDAQKKTEEKVNELVKVQIRERRENNEKTNFLLFIFFSFQFFSGSEMGKRKIRFIIC